MSVIEVRGLTAWAGTSALLRGVDLDVPAGGVTALVGPSGSGKTTAALALLGDTAPGVRLSGAVRVAGTTVVDEHGVTREAAGLRGGTIAYMPQHPGSALNPARRTGAVLTELTRLHHRPGPGSPDGRAAARDRAAQALRAAQLPPETALRRFPHQFSGGQRQRVALAQVLACGPRALVLDEPGTGLDTVTRMGLARELAALARSGMAILLLSHDHDMVRALADRVVLLEDGRVTGAGTPGTLLPAGAVPDAVHSAPHAGHSVPDAAHSVPDTGDRSPDEPEPVLSVRNLTAWLRPGGRGVVLHDISLSLPRGGCVAVAGPSGSGKTTLARCIAGLHERCGGGILLDGTELPVLRRRTRPQKRRVQYVWQEVRGSFDERRSVLEQVARTAVRLRGRSPDRAVAEAADLLTRLGVAESTAGRLPESLSGGELQRAAFARAVLAAPDVLVCDEITAALDEVATGLVRDEVTRLRQEQGTAVLWIGHDLGLLRQVADRLVVLDNGRIVEEGPPAQVVGAPRSTTARLLVRAERLGAGQVAVVADDL
ncbi:ABC transporter ATP-binding protein [Streptomyces sp. NBC_01089]|uniref:ABC transporter ATP-binding protein n=1 Tax=Streptomyces sp. NBC_01089 TaxID=2903747 RepID=UPI0038668E77|nr:ATP-binding cassette domain-containing protein [Streptomyces sp. NBC_01089]